MPHEIKVNGYKPSKWPSRPEMNVDAHEKPAVQPDWEQNDESQPDYIKNRPFYDSEWVENLGSDYNAWEAARALFGNDTLIVNINVMGVDYPAAHGSTENNGRIVLYYCGSFILQVDRGTRIISLNATGSALIDPTVKAYYFYKITRKAVKQIDPKFIPNVPLPSNAAPSAPGTPSAGTSSDYARADHVHPSELELFAVNWVRTGMYTYSPDKTFDEVLAAIEAGKMVVAYWGGDFGRPYDLETGGSDQMRFIRSNGTTCSYIYYYPDGTYETKAEYFLDVFEVTSDGLERFGNLIGGMDREGFALVGRYGAKSDATQLIARIRPIEVVSSSDGKLQFCGAYTSGTSLSEAKTWYANMRVRLVYNGEPFIAAELTDSSITIVYMGKGEDGQYGVQKTTFGDITWKSETT